MSATLEAAPGPAVPSFRQADCGCRHCGGPLVSQKMKDDGFCCSGCAYVFRLVHEHGLAGYYRIKDAVTPAADAAVFQPGDFAWLEQAQREAEAASLAAGGRAPEMALALQGVSCAGCVWLIERLFRQARGARDINVNAQLGSMTWRWTAGAFCAADFARTLQSFGYLAGPDDPGRADPESGDLGGRIGLCAAFALNVMLFTLPAYFGMEKSSRYAPLFGLLSLAFGTLSFLVGGSYFLGRAWRALRAGAMHIDMPIALGILGAYVGSVLGWLAGDARWIYFDFLAVFILLMLVGRWAQVTAVERNRRQLLGRQPKPRTVRLMAEPDATRAVMPEQLRAGDRFLIASGQTVPVDGRLLTSEGIFSLASIHGEPEARSFRAGQRVPSGGVNVGRGDVAFEGLQSWGESLLAQLMRPGERKGWRQALMERIVRGYLIGIIAAAVAAGIGWWMATGDPGKAGAVVIAVLVVSCPCAIGFAYPLVEELAATALRRRGVYIREADAWARLSAVRKVVFDKTGTLTLETPVLQNPSAVGALDQEERNALYALVRDGQHPASQSLLEAVLAAGPAEAAGGDVKETVGFGVELGPWSLGRAGWRPTARAGWSGSFGGVEGAVGATEFARDGRIVARFGFADSARPGARAELEALERAGLQVHILSGDCREKVLKLAGELGLPPDRALGGLSPAEKAAWFDADRAGDALMLGDGANDSLAFDRALCRGTPVIHRGVLEGKADFYYLGRGIGGIRCLFSVNALRRRTQTRILVFSVAYNAVAVGLAIAGWVNPLVAAVLMPANSLVTLALASVGMRRAFTRAVLG